MTIADGGCSILSLTPSKTRSSSIQETLKGVGVSFGEISASIGSVVIMPGADSHPGRVQRPDPIVGMRVDRILAGIPGRFVSVANRPPNVGRTF